MFDVRREKKTGFRPFIDPSTWATLKTLLKYIAEKRGVLDVHVQWAKELLDFFQKRWNYSKASIRCGKGHLIALTSAIGAREHKHLFRLRVEQ